MEARSRNGGRLVGPTTLTIALDAVFFENGAFTGADASGFVARTETEFRAKRELYSHIALGAELRVPFEELRLYLAQVAWGVDVGIDEEMRQAPSVPPAEAHYARMRSIYAHNLLASRYGLVDSTLASHVVEALSQLPTLRRLV
jgi:hypothetical protein